jgi:hypothetical protein
MVEGVNRVEGHTSQSRHQDSWYPLHDTWSSLGLYPGEEVIGTDYIVVVVDSAGVDHNAVVVHSVDRAILLQSHPIHSVDVLPLLRQPPWHPPGLAIPAPVPRH